MNKTKSLIRALAVSAALCLCMGAHAGVRLPSLLSDGMVLQRGRDILIWGWADCGEAVSVDLLKGGRRVADASATADAEGRWSVTLPAMKAGGPYTLNVNNVTVNDILVGDVWLCSGQSNMELPVSRVTDMFADEVASYSDDEVRQFKVPKTYDFHAPQEDMPASSWVATTPGTALDFSALGYFLAKELHGRTGVPIGIINASWGGTPIEAWLSEDAISAFPMHLNEKRLYEDDGYLKRLKDMEGENFHRWDTALHFGDPGMQESPRWYSPDCDDSDWQEVGLFDSGKTWGTDGLNPIAGSHWLRKTVELPKSLAGREAVLRLGCMVDADSTFVNGVYVGNTTYQYPPRIYRIPAGLLKEGGNVVTVRLVSNGGLPSFVKEKPYKIVFPAVDGQAGEEVSLEGLWKYRLGAPMPKGPSQVFFCYEPVCLYNAMIAPLRNYGVSGVVWYQGESNVSRRNEYASLLRAMMSDWREAFGEEGLPFFIVELADFLSKDDVGGRAAWAGLRSQQAEAAEGDANAVLIPNSDLGEWNDIHPLDKKTLAHRVAEAIMKMENQ